MGAPLNGGIQLFRYASHRPHLPLYGDLPVRASFGMGAFPLMAPINATAKAMPALGPSMGSPPVC